MFNSAELTKVLQINGFDENSSIGSVMTLFEQLGYTEEEKKRGIEMLRGQGWALPSSVVGSPVNNINTTLPTSVSSMATSSIPPNIDTPEPQPIKYDNIDVESKIKSSSEKGGDVFYLIIILIVISLLGGTAYAYVKKIGPFVSKSPVVYTTPEKQEENVETVASSTIENSGVNLLNGSSSVDNIDIKNKTISDSKIFVIDLSKKYKTEGKTSCTKIPSQIGDYKLIKASITNEVRDGNAHSSFWDTITGEMYSINVDEKIFITYSNGGTKPEDNITAEIFRYKNPNDLDRVFGEIFGFKTGDYSTTTNKSGVVGYKKYIYRRGNSMVMVSSKNESIIKMIGKSLVDYCYNEPVFRTDTPIGFVKKNVSDIDQIGKEQYAKFADSDLTVYLDQNYFSINPFVRLNEEPLVGESVSMIDKFLLFSFFTYDKDTRKLRPYHDVQLFVMKKSMKEDFLNFVRKYDVSFVAAIERSEINQKIISETSGEYTDNSYIGKVPVISLKTDRKKEGDRSQQIDIFFVERGNTIFAFLYEFDDYEVIKSVLDNLR